MIRQNSGSDFRKSYINAIAAIINDLFMYPKTEDSTQQDNSNEVTIQESGDDLNGDGNNSNDGFQFIRFQAFQPASWHALYDQSFKKL